ncbi:hypothetical protein SAMN05421788_112131 [Filimonas lacunae]|uniref:Calcineurin-like phosphoesterase domain-containing protein n=1 Tax=Filimonas lacunae TaxID=477680 RepID=A0A173MKZ9_9BACT|nr:hypothetical protein [Filimonas lacunae]BAV08322.1 hypothetical protein FLA_4358 [Filimonas lacunae]SIT33360.1 hypothetical protein SAMN05421788_112131 [Filimonas lacunae]
MLVIISDLHLTDGTSGEIISKSAFRLFKNRLSNMAYDASWRREIKDCSTCTNGKVCSNCYRPVECIDILLLGDILDAIRSEKWNKTVSDVVPWTTPRDNGFYQEIDKIVTGILDYNSDSLRILSGLVKDSDISIPLEMYRATQQDKDKEKIDYSASKERWRVPVKIYYMVGNHDWFFHIDDPRMVAINNKVIDRMGLANEKGKPFPYHRCDSAAIAATQDAHRVFAEHGDRFDKTNCQYPNRNESSVGDVVVVELLNCIPELVGEYLQQHAGRRYGAKQIEAFVNQLREIDNLRPYTLAPAWITHVKKQLGMEDPVVNDAIKHTLQTVLQAFIKSPLVVRNKGLVWKMKLARWLLGHISVDTLASLLQRTPVVKDNIETYQAYARQLAAGESKDFFVMGHTHYAEVVPLSTYIGEDGEVRSKIYINTGTWRSVHLQGVEGRFFISYKTMTMAGFFKGDERKGRPFECWTGSLAL